MGNALRRNSFRKHQEKVGPEEVIEENLDRPVSLRPGSLAPPKEFPQVFPPFFHSFSFNRDSFNICRTTKHAE